jgi:phage terminase large subunit-like protein
LSDQTDIYIRGARNPDKTLYFPELLSEEKLKELRGLQGSYIFSCFYLNDPIDDESAIIKRSQLKYYGEGESNQLPQNLNMFSVCDPAVSQSESADESSIITVGVDIDNNWWVLETRSGQWTTMELIENLFSVHAQWKPITMTLEVIGQAQGIMLPIHDEEDRRKIYLPLMEITSRGQIKKEIRIRSVLQPRFERGKVFIKRDMVDLEDQLVRFPHCNRDDMIDALTDVEDIAFSAESPEQPYKESGSHLQDILNKQKLEKEGYYDPVMGMEW